LIDIFNFDEKQNFFKPLARFFINLMTIPHSNSFVEQQFSQVGIIKTDIRNQLEVATVSSLIKVKSYYK